MSGALAIIGGTGVGNLDIDVRPETIHTEYGDVTLGRGAGEYDGLWFLSRHGPNREWPPHMISYRANIKALAEVSVSHAVATFAVGSADDTVPPGRSAVLDQYIDLTSNRPVSFFEGGYARTEPWWLDVSEPFCSALRTSLLDAAAEHDLGARDGATYACFNGPRLETSAEVRMASILGGNVIGMTLCPEAALAAEIGIHYAGLAVSVNWAAGLQSELRIDTEAQSAMKSKLFPVMYAALQRVADDCRCDHRRGVA